MSKRNVEIGKISKLNLKSLSKNDYFDIIQYLDTGNITKNNILNLQLLKPKKDKIPSRAKRRVKKNTIIYSTVRPNQEHYGFLENPENNLIVSTGFTTIDIVDENIYPKFVYYLITQKEITEYLHTIGMSATSSYPSIKPEDIGNLKFKVPERLEDQQKIASVLSTLDAKIELNNKINAKLEAMAKTLYDYWFAQFDFPDENGKPYKSSGGEMVYDEKLKREIPKGWEVKKLKDILKKNNKKFNLNDKKHNIDTIDLSVMPSSTMCLNEKNTSDEFGTNLFEMNKFDILFGGIRPYLLKAGFAPFSGLVTGTVHSFDVIYEYDYNFALLTMIHESMFQFAISNSKGTKMPVVGADDLLEYKLAYNENIVKKFNEIVFFKEIISKNILENQKLAELRDFLLPMLMNGRVVVK